MLAALAAGLAFASLALSGLTALRQLGVLCGIGEVLTAAAILLMTPEIGAHLERKAPPPERVPRWLGAVKAVTATRARAKVALAIAALPVLGVLLFGWPPAANALVAIRPRALAPLATQEAIFERFGGRPGQWIVVAADPDPERAEARADRIAEALEPLAAEHAVDGFDALAPYMPAEETQRMRLAARDALDLPARRAVLEAALIDRGFDTDACAPALDAFAHPGTRVAPMKAAPEGMLAWIVSRHLARDGDDTLAVVYVRPRGDPASYARALDAIHAADPGAIVTGYPHLEVALKESLAHDLPRVALVALFLVALTLRSVLGRTRDMLLALVTNVV
jgi:predicted exporter